MADKTIALRLDKDLYDRIAEDASRENRSVNNYIVTKLSDTVPTNNLEQRQIVGSVVKGDKINMANDLIEVKGIYYRILMAFHRDGLKMQFRREISKF